MQVHRGVEPGGIPRRGERLVDAPHRQTAGAFGDPQGRLGSDAKGWPDFDAPLLEDRDDPVDVRDRQHGASLRFTAPRGLAPADEQAAVPPERGDLRIVPEVGQVESPGFAAPQSEGVDRFQQCRVPHRRQRALTAPGADVVDEAISGVEQRLHFVVGERTPAWVAFVLADMYDGVPLMQNLRRRHAEPLHTFFAPAVTGVGQVLQEHPQRGLVQPSRRRHDRPRTVSATVDERLHIGALPFPRVLVGEGGDPPRQPEPRADRRALQESRPLLQRPPLEHRLEHRRLRIEMTNSRDEHQVRRTR